MGRKPSQTQSTWSLSTTADMVRDRPTTSTRPRLLYIWVLLLPALLVNGQKEREAVPEEGNKKYDQCSHPFHSFLCNPAPKPRKTPPSRNPSEPNPVPILIGSEGASSFNVKNIVEPSKDTESTFQGVPYLPPIEPQPSSVSRTVSVKPSTTNPTKKPAFQYTTRSTSTPTTQSPSTTRYYSPPTEARTTTTRVPVPGKPSATLGTDSSYARESTLKPVPYLPPSVDLEESSIDAQAARATAQVVKPKSKDEDQCKHPFHTFLCSPRFTTSAGRNRLTGAFNSKTTPSTRSTTLSPVSPHVPPRTTTNLGFEASFLQPTKVQSPHGLSGTTSRPASSHDTSAYTGKQSKTDSPPRSNEDAVKSVTESFLNQPQSLASDLCKTTLRGFSCNPLTAQEANSPSKVLSTTKPPTVKPSSLSYLPPPNAKGGLDELRIGDVAQAAQDAPVRAEPDSHAHTNLCDDPFHSFLCQKVDTSKRRQQYGQRFQKPGVRPTGANTSVQPTKVVPPRNSSDHSSQVILPTYRPQVRSKLPSAPQTQPSNQLLSQASIQSKETRPLPYLPPPVALRQEGSFVNPSVLVVRQPTTTTRKPTSQSSDSLLPVASSRSVPSSTTPRSKPTTRFTAPQLQSESHSLRPAVNKDQSVQPRPTITSRPVSIPPLLSSTSPPQPTANTGPAASEVQPQAAHTSNVRLPPDEGNKHDHHHDHHHHHPPGFDICKDPFHSFLCEPPKPRRRFTGQRQTFGRKEPSVTVANTLQQPTVVLPPTPRQPSSTVKPTTLPTPQTTPANLTGSDSFQQSLQVLPPTAKGQKTSGVTGYSYPKPSNPLEYPRHQSSERPQTLKSDSTSLQEASTKLSQAGYSYPKPSVPFHETPVHHNPTQLPGLLPSRPSTTLTNPNQLSEPASSSIESSKTFPPNSISQQISNKIHSYTKPEDNHRSSTADNVTYTRSEDQFSARTVIEILNISNRNPEGHKLDEVTKPPVIKPSDVPTTFGSYSRPSNELQAPVEDIRDRMFLHIKSSESSDGGGQTAHASDPNPAYFPAPYKRALDKEKEFPPLPADFVRGPSGTALPQVQEKCGYPFQGYSCKKNNAGSHTRRRG